MAFTGTEAARILEPVFEQSRGAEPPPKFGRRIDVRPSKPVWVHLNLVYPVGRTWKHCPDGLDLQERVPGELMMWERTTTGHWVGYVSFGVCGAGSAVRMGQWVLSDALEPRVDVPARPE